MMEILGNNGGSSIADELMRGLLAGRGIRREVLEELTVDQRHALMRRIEAYRGERGEDNGNSDE